MYARWHCEYAPAFEPILEGFKAGMEAEGCIEGENVTYLYDGTVQTPDALLEFWKD